MVIFAKTFMPILMVLKNGGSMNLLELSEKLNEADQRRFRDLQCVERALAEYSGCLEIKEDTVCFNHNARRYTQDPMDEREVSHLLHENISDMYRFELYPHKTPANSQTCPIGIPWKDIPKNRSAVRAGLDPYRLCDFRGEGEDKCDFSCEVKANILKSLGLKCERTL
jgi:hypothetical protein